MTINDDDMARIMDTLYLHRAPNLPHTVLADIFDRLIWCLDDNGEALLKVRERWLSSGDRGRVDLALAMDETFPFGSAQQMKDALSRISAKWPDLEAQCNKLIEGRARVESGA